MEPYPGSGIRDPFCCSLSVSYTHLNSAATLPQSANSQASNAGSATSAKKMCIRDRPQLAALALAVIWVFWLRAKLQFPHQTVTLSAEWAMLILKFILHHLRSVSYTHLDVYKRQALILPFSSGISSSAYSITAPCGISFCLLNFLSAV